MPSALGTRTSDGNSTSGTPFTIRVLFRSNPQSPASTPEPRATPNGLRRSFNAGTLDPPVTGEM